MSPYVYTHNIDVPADPHIDKLPARALAIYVCLPDACPPMHEMKYRRIERVWKEMKARWVQNGVFTLVEDVTHTVRPPDSGFYWIDASVEDLEILQPLFHIHELEVEDCISDEEQRPKIETYDNHYFIVMNSIRFDDEEIFLRSLNIFLGRHFIITVTKQKINEIRSLKPLLWEEEVDSPDRFLYHLIDLIVDNYVIVGDRIEDKIEKLEEDILLSTKKSHLNEIIGLRGEILWLRKVLMPQKEVIASLNKRDLRLINPQLQKYFGDTLENAVKIAETFETLRDLMGNLREAYQSSLNNQANQIMRVFTALTTIFMPLTFITGVYGMNVEDVPLMHHPLGGIIVLSFMLLVGAGMYILFKKKDWL